jgi:hypothetical protein
MNQEMEVEPIIGKLKTNKKDIDLEKRKVEKKNSLPLQIVINEDFVKNYFNGGNNTGLNVRKQTTHLQNQWKNHNAAFDQSAVNGDLIWRVKAYNVVSQSIDYIEIWKDLETVNRLFEVESKLDNGEVWSKDQKSSLGQGVWDAGFIVRHYRPYQSISKLCAVSAYKMFVDRYKNKDKCIINTPMKSNL